MFGARGPLLEEKDGGGSGGQPPPKGDKPAEVVPPEKKSAEDKLFTQADLDKHITERLDRERRKWSSDRDGKPSNTDTKNNSKAENPGDPSWIFDFTDTLDALCEEREIKPSRGLKAKLRTAFAAERPDNPHAWMSEWFDDVGLKKSTPNPQQPQQPENGDGKMTKQLKTGEGLPQSDKGGAGGVVLDYEAKLAERPLELTKSDIDRIMEKHGPVKGCVMIRDAVDRKLKNIKLVADPRRKAS